MKKLLAFLFLFFFLRATSQVEFGLRLGTNISSISDQVSPNLSNGVGISPMYGLFLEQKISNTFNINYGLNVNTFKYYRRGTFSQNTSFTIPFTFKWHINKKIALGAGPQFNFLLVTKQRKEYELLDIKYVTSFKHFFSVEIPSMGKSYHQNINISIGYKLNRLSDSKLDKLMPITR